MKSEEGFQIYQMKIDTMTTDQLIYNQVWEIHLQLSKKHTSETSITFQQLDFLRAQLKADVAASTFGTLAACFRQLNDPGNVPLIEPYISRKDPTKAAAALWTLCWLDQTERLKPYILEAIEPGLPWDNRRKVSNNAISGIGHYLRNHRDRDFAQLILRWATRGPDDEFYKALPPGQRSIDLEMSANRARTAAGIAMGVDPSLLVDNEDLRDATVERFVAERQDG